MVNLFMNYILLFLTATMTQEQTNTWRLGAGSMLGACYGICVLFPQLRVLQMPQVKILFSLLMVCLAFGFRGQRRFIRLLLYFYLLAFVIGGTTFALYFIGFSSGFIDPFLPTVDNVSLWIVLLAVFIVMLTVKLIWLFMGRQQRSELFMPLRIRFDSAWVEVMALVDTGNQLWDPFSHNPVIIMESGVLENVLPEEVLTFYRGGDFVPNHTAAIENPKWIKRCYYIPFTGLGTNNGLLFSIRPDEINLRVENQWQQSKPAMVGLINRALNHEGNYRALLHPALLDV
jgi:stage II sporulation protein GA (sporulation sigma-E factor processing peptidase)